jgi:regulator of protease activity HflC (stomatin/prohibitin superfamily)
VRLIGIFQSKGTEIIHFGLINPGIPKSVSEEIRTAARAKAEKDKAITDAQAQKETTILQAQGVREKKILEGEGEANALSKQNEVELQKLEKEAVIRADATYLLYEAEAKGITKLANSLGLKDDEKKLIKILETLEKGMKDNNLNIIMGGDTNLDTFLKMAMQKISQPNTTKTN